MRTDKNDTKSNNSKSAIVSAYLMLLKNGYAENITVSAVCTKAGVNRGTFYNHYLNLEDLHDDIFHHYVNEIVIKAVLIDFTSLDALSFCPIFETMLSYETITSVMLSSLSDSDYGYVAKVIEGGSLSSVRAAYPFMTEKDVEAYLYIILRGAIFLAMKYINEQNYNTVFLSGLLFDYSNLVINYFRREKDIDENRAVDGSETKRKKGLNFRLSFSEAEEEDGN